MKKQDNDTLIRCWLWRYYDAKHDVIRLQYEYNEMAELHASVGGISYDGMPGPSGDIADLSNMLIVKEEALKKLLLAKNRQARVLSEISEAIAKLDYAIERDIVSMRYLTFQEGCQKNDWAHISDSLGFSEVHVKRVHAIAIDKLITIVGTAKLKKMILNDTK